MKYSFLVVFLLSFLSVAAQNQHANWHFGFGAGLNFSSGNPVAVGGSMMSTTESCASISDANGNRLFYTNGTNVWNGANGDMPNGSGLLGHHSSQCIIIPRPGNPGKYYIVVTDAIEHSCVNGITYSEVDMSLQGGFGDVTAVKNISLNAPNGEWVTAVHHANCVDSWIITHGRGANSFFLAYHVSAAGIDPVPVATDLGISVQTNLESIGIMRPNPQGTAIAMSRSYVQGKVELITFDNATGVATGMTNLHTSTTNDMSYGLEFSRSGKRLYVGEFGMATYNSIFQYDLTAADIPATRTKVGQVSFSPGEIGQLQIAPNDKIYVNYNLYPSVDFIGAITNPELVGTACGFVENAVSFGANTIYGLPWYFNAAFMQESPLELGPDTLLCPGASVMLANGSMPVAGATYLWSDGSTGTTLQVSEPGTYWVQYQVASCLTATDSIIVTSDTTQIRHLVDDTTGCTPFTVQLAGTGPPGVYGWSWGMGNGTVLPGQHPSFVYTTPGIYTISLSATSAWNCPVHDSTNLVVEALPVPTAAFSIQPLLVEPNIPVVFTDQSTGAVTSWLWQLNGQQVSTASSCSYTPTDYYQPLTVSLTVTNADGCSDEKTVDVFKPGDLVYVPNTFTPDGNAFNAVFQPVDYFGLVTEFTVYNRWGEQVWFGTSANDGWDGTIAGQSAMPGVYTWVITMADRGVSQQLRGHVTLVR